MTSSPVDPDDLAGATAQGGAGTVVVGIDASPHSGHALRWALEQARLTAASVRAVTCWEWPPSLGMTGSVDLDLAGAAREAAQRVVDEVLSEVPDAAPVHLQVIEGYPGQVLVEEAAAADLLVVGSRGRGALGRMLLGSVGLHCASHAPCPVVIVPDPAEPRPPA